MQGNTSKTLRYFIAKFKNYKLLLFLTILGITMGVFGNIAWVLLFREFINQLSLELPRAEIAIGLFTTLLLIMAVELFEFIGWRLSAYINNYLQPKLMADILNESFYRIQNHSYKFFSNNFAGALVKKISRLASSFEVIMDKILWDIIPLILQMTLIIGFLFYLHPYLGIALLVWTILFILLNYYLSIYKLKFDIQRSKTDSQVTASLADAITNSTNIKLFANLDHEHTKFKSTTQVWYKAWKKSADINSHIEAFQAITMVILEFVIIYIAIQLWVSELINTADFFAIQAYILEVFHQLWNFGRVIRDIYEKLADAEEMTEILNQPLGIIDKPKAKTIKINKGKIEFKDVNFSYHPNRKIFENFNLKIKPSEKIALIGPSGGGKTSTIKLLLRLFEPTSGQILIDNQPTSEFTQASLRKQISLVPQEPILFHRSIFENIHYGNLKATKKEVIAASKLAYCHDFIQKLPKKYNTHVGERGVKLSGGEKQRIAIARAILANSQILILDEATSSLDSESEQLIQKAVTNLMKNKTAIIIAHRLSTIQTVDRIVVIKNGKIIEQGSHAEIVQKEGGTYKKLWNLQIGGYLK